MPYFRRILTVCAIAFLGLGCHRGNTVVEEAPPKPESRETVARINRFDEYGGGTPLYQAMFGGDVDTVEYLLSIGADVNKGTEDGETPLHVAAAAESERALELVKTLVAHGADVNARIESKGLPEGTTHMAEGWTPLHEAMTVLLPGTDFEAHSNIDVVKFLVDHGADVNATDTWGCTPLFYAQFLDIAELLVARGTDLDIKNTEDGGTVLHDAASTGDLEAVKLFVSHGADIDARNFEGETPLHKAALFRDPAIVDYLVSEGADLSARSKRGETPQGFLDERNDAEPILLSEDGERPFRLIVTDGLHIREVLKAERIDYDTLWFPGRADVDGLDQALETWLEEDAPGAKGGLIAPEYILSHFEEYRREYAGFVHDGVQYIVCNMIQAPSDPALEGPLRNRFTGMFDGGCAQVVVVFEARSREVAACRCNAS